MMEAAKFTLNPEVSPRLSFNSDPNTESLSADGPIIHWPRTPRIFWAHH